MDKKIEKDFNISKYELNKLLKEHDRYQKEAARLTKQNDCLTKELESTRLEHRKLIDEMCRDRIFSSTTNKILRDEIEDLRHRGSGNLKERMQALEKRNYDLKMRLMCPAHLRVDDKTIPFLSTQIIFLGQELEALRDELRLPQKDVVKFGQELWKEKKNDV